ncbi:MAG TPA: hypothetical protein VG056_16035 [Pirellulales bacterium]|jgi:hypothetical protein|nr:hypothetical protein [Pirellulales bacterium]
MAGTPLTCGFERLTPRQARAVLAVATVVTLFFVAISLSPLASGFADAPSRGASDIELYKAEVARIHGGEGYYDAAAMELTARGYPTRSVFNWRPPLPVWLLGVLPDPQIGRWVLGMLALGGVLLATQFVARDQGVRRGLMCGLWMTGALLPCFLDSLYVMHELWAGALILLSILAYGAKRPAWGAAAGFVALLFRELAAPYCGLCFVLAIRERRWKEIYFWLIAGAVYGIGYVAHILEVLPRIAPDARAHAEGWLCLGGTPFVISLAQMNAFLLLLPQWVTAIFLAMALLGFAGWTAPWGRRAALATSLYLALFAAIGQPFNQYWGAMVAPLLCLGIAQAPEALTTLWRRASASKSNAATLRAHAY